jgi:hypothetical protein
VRGCENSECTLHECNVCRGTYVTNNYDDCDDDDGDGDDDDDDDDMECRRKNLKQQERRIRVLTTKRNLLYRIENLP